jgi:putative transposase
VERCQCRSARAQRNHIGLALRAFLRLEAYCFARGVSWVEAKAAVVRDAVCAYLTKPHIQFPAPATA